MTTVTLLITDVAYGGRGVARLENGKVCFVPGVLTGETVRAVVLHERDGFAEARLREVVNPSPARVTPACPLAYSCSSSLYCPGCTYQHVDYMEEVRIKQHQLVSLLSRQAGIDPDLIQPPVPAPLPLGYRNKLSLHAQKDGKETRLGYFADDNQTVLDVPACPLADPAMNRCLAELRNDASFRHGLRDGMTLTFRHTGREAAVWWRGEPRANETWLVENTLLGLLSVPRGSFFQVNPPVAGLLLSQIMGSLQTCAPRTVIDLFCGVGLFSLAAAKAGVPETIGIDVDGPGIVAAEFNARKLNLTGIRWEAANAQKALAKLGPTMEADSTALIVDPPRNGLGRALVQDILRHPPRHLFYISCAPDTMVRDLAWLKEGGYIPERTQLFDMFPRTSHFESLTILRHRRTGT
jgi:23S rRNA (uracil1939-C5)-methyltransferase